MSLHLFSTSLGVLGGSLGTRQQLFSAFDVASAVEPTKDAETSRYVPLSSWVGLRFAPDLALVFIASANHFQVLFR